MLTAEENKLLTQVGPGTPGGELMRRYWHPIAATSMLDENPVRPVRILSEDLTLFRDRQGRLGLIGQRCPHRAFDMRFGIPEQEGLRCPYHGWMFDGTGACVEQPLEPPDSTYKDRVKTKAYKVEDLGGLIWAYLGPDPAPLVPRWDLLVREDCFRQIYHTMLPCNWLQVMENRADPAHAYHLHGRLFQYVYERKGLDFSDPLFKGNSFMRAKPIKLGVRWNKYGFNKRLMTEGQDETSPTWQIGTNPVLFPYTLRLGTTSLWRHQLQIGVPVDDTHTWHMHYAAYILPEGIEPPPQPSIPHVDVPFQDENGEYILDFNSSQDWVGWWAQGETTDRAEEHLGYTDVIITQYRKMLKEQIRLVADGGEPINVFRDPEENQYLESELLSSRRNDDANEYRRNYHNKSYLADDVERFAPDADTLVELSRQIAELAATKSS